MKKSRLFLCVLAASLLSSCGGGAKPVPGGKDDDKRAIYNSYQKAIYQSFGLKTAEDGKLYINEDLNFRLSVTAPMMGMNEVFSEYKQGKSFACQNGFNYQQYMTDTPVYSLDQGGHLRQENDNLSVLYVYNREFGEYEESKDTYAYPFHQYLLELSRAHTNLWSEATTINYVNDSVTVDSTFEGHHVIYTLNTKTDLFSYVCFADELGDRFSISFEYGPQTINFPTNIHRTPLSDIFRDTLNLLRNRWRLFKNRNINELYESFHFESHEFKPKEPQFGDYGYWWDNIFDVDKNTMTRKVLTQSEDRTETLDESNMHIEIDDLNNIQKVVYQDSKNAYLEVASNEFVLASSVETVSTGNLWAGFGNMDANSFVVSEDDPTYFTYKDTNGGYQVDYYQYVLNVDYSVDIVSSFSKEAYHNGQLVQHESWAISDLGQVEVPSFEGEALTMQQIADAAKANLVSKPHRLVLMDYEGVCEYGDVLEYDISDTNVQIMHLVPVNGQEAYLKMDFSGEENIYTEYVSNGQSYQASIIDESVYDTKYGTLVGLLSAYLDDDTHTEAKGAHFDMYASKSVLVDSIYLYNPEDSQDYRDGTITLDYADPEFTRLSSIRVNNKFFYADSITNAYPRIDTAAALTVSTGSTSVSMAYDMSSYTKVADSTGTINNQYKTSYINSVGSYTDEHGISQTRTVVCDHWNRTGTAYVRLLITDDSLWSQDSPDPGVELVNGRYSATIVVEVSLNE